MIQTTLHQEEQPAPLTNDSRGNPLIIGANVAYNLSGAVQVGILKNINKNYWKAKRKGVGKKMWWYHEFDATVINEDSERLSTIRNIYSLTII